ncbi:MAG: hypothetical protein KGR68_11155 [Betaproteobacteria bacterium]|nr:hypothetical protein [Betaproteobacteria bacterium]
MLRSIGLAELAGVGGGAVVDARRGSAESEPACVAGLAGAADVAAG